MQDRVLQALLSMVEDRRSKGGTIHINLFFLHDINDHSQILRAVKTNGQILQKELRRNGKAARKKKRI